MRVLIAALILMAEGIVSVASAGIPSGGEILKASGAMGGVVVHLGCGDGALTVALHVRDSFLVQGLDTAATTRAAARRLIQSKGLEGRVSVAAYDGRHLPYVDNLVNVLVVSDPASVAQDEMRRVVAPGGAIVTISGSAGSLDVWKKPRPSEIDEWTHYLHGPDNNAVAQDTVVGPPRHFQWISEPRFSRSHDHLSSISAVVSSGGRVFSIIDMGSIAFAGASSRWRLVARDAFNGVLLWQREIPKWEYHLRDFRSGPADIARKLVAIGDRVYVTLGYGEPITALDAATGKTLKTYDDTKDSQEILVNNNTLYAVIGTRDVDWRSSEAQQIVSQPDYVPPFEKDTPPTRSERVVAVNATTGKVVWQCDASIARDIMPSTLAVSTDRVYFQTATAVVCLDGTTGQLKWQVPRAIQRSRLAWSTPTLVVHDGLVYSADRVAAKTDGDMLWIPSGGYHDYIRGEVQGQLIAYDAETGKRVWESPAYEGFNAPVDILISDNLLWTGRYAWGNDPGITVARDLKTGEVRRKRASDQEVLPRMGHARCHRAKCTSKYVVLGRRGVEFLDVETGGIVANFWLRGTCQFGVLPANGLLYVPPHACACSVGDMLKAGFMAFAPERKETETPLAIDDPTRLTKGPAYKKINATSSEEGEDWPMYRCNAKRNGAVAADVSPELKVAWQTPVGNRLTSPVIAEGVLLVVATDAHRVDALDAKSGKKLWSFSAEARIDSAPTIYQSRAVFGSADGRVYCLRLKDGVLSWQFDAARQRRQIIADDQLESSWPVSGSVLVVDGSVYFVAGRSSYVDGGMAFYQLDAASGETIRAVPLEVDAKKRDGGVASGGYLADILSADQNSIFLRNSRFSRTLERESDNVPHLWSSVGFLDHNWWHRTYWQIGTAMGSGWGGWPKEGQRVPAGRILVTSGDRVFGYGRNQYDIPGAHVGVDAEGVWGPIGKEQGHWTFYELFGQKLRKQPEAKSRRKGPGPKTADSLWKRRIPVLVQGMVLANDTLFVAGPVDPVSEVPHDPEGSDPLVEALATIDGGTLMAVSTADGSTLKEMDLPSPPTFDGMAAANGRLYLSTKAGTIVCLAP